MPKTTQTLAIADAMFAVDSKSWEGVSLYPARMQWGFNAWNATASVNQRCLAAHPGDDGYKCTCRRPRYRMLRIVCLQHPNSDLG